MTTSGFRVRVTGLVFVFKSASLVLKQVPTCIRKPKTNTFDKSIRFSYWLYLVVFGRFQIVLGRFSSFQLVPHFSKYPDFGQGMKLRTVSIKVYFIYLYRSCRPGVFCKTLFLNTSPNSQENMEYFEEAIKLLPIKRFLKKLKLIKILKQKST